MKKLHLRVTLKLPANGLRPSARAPFGQTSKSLQDDVTPRAGALKTCASGRRPPMLERAAGQRPRVLTVVYHKRAVDDDVLDADGELLG